MFLSSTFDSDFDMFDVVRKNLFAVITDDRWWNVSANFGSNFYMNSQENFWLLAHYRENPIFILSLSSSGSSMQPFKDGTPVSPSFFLSYLYMYKFLLRHIKYMFVFINKW